MLVFQSQSTLPAGFDGISVVGLSLTGSTIELRGIGIDSVCFAPPFPTASPNCTYFCAIASVSFRAFEAVSCSASADAAGVDVFGGVAVFGVAWSLAAAKSDDLFRMASSVIDGFPSISSAFKSVHSFAGEVFPSADLEAGVFSADLTGVFISDTFFCKVRSLVSIENNVSSKSRICSLASCSDSEPSRVKSIVWSGDSVSSASTIIAVLSGMGASLRTLDEAARGETILGVMDTKMSLTAASPESFD